MHITAMQSISQSITPPFPHFFSLMIRRPPRSTLFPTRRSSDLHVFALGGVAAALAGVLGGVYFNAIDPQRSEEHTSELQSRQYLVCRLLLEKKKTNNLKILY